MSAPHHPPPPWDDGKCQECVNEKVQAYLIKRPHWTVEEARKYARFKCPCTNQPCKVEPWWMHWLTVSLLIAIAAYVFYVLTKKQP